MQPNQPGQIIEPHNDVPTATSPAPNPLVMPQAPVVQVAQTQPAPAPVPQPQASAAVQAPAPESDWSFHAEEDANIAATQSSYDATPISWTASEFIAHDKSPTWYMVLIGAGVIGAVLIYLLTKDIFSSIIILVVAICFGVFASRKPRTVQYAIDDYGLHAGAKSFPLESFKSFSLSDETAVAGIVFMPLKRFMPPITIYVAPEIADKALQFLSQRLPLEQHKPDAVDGLLRKIRF